MRGEYFDSTDFTSLKLSRVDPGVNFDWGTGAPDPAMEPEEFSVRWTGQVTAPATGTYTFHVITDDGVRLYVDNQLLIDRWVGQGATEWTVGGYIAQVAGVLNFILKSVVGVTVMMWIRWTLPRLRIDQVMTTCLKYCVPLAAMFFVGAMVWKLYSPFFINDIAPLHGRRLADVRESWVLAPNAVGNATAAPPTKQPAGEKPAHPAAKPSGEPIAVSSARGEAQP